MILEFIAVLFIILSIGSCFVIHKQRTEIDKEKARRHRTQEKLVGVTSELASIRVKHGQTWEVFLPLMETFEKEIGAKEYAIFLGQPIDLIYFKPDEIVFVEVKTGNSKLSQRQRVVRHLVKEKKIRWVEVNDDMGDGRRVSTNPIMKVVPHRND